MTQRQFAVSSILAISLCVNAASVDFDTFFSDSTLRIDYIFSGTNNAQHIALDQLSKTAGWYGRRHNLSSLPLEGNGQLTLVDPETDDTLYRHSFSTLFQEWQETEAKMMTMRNLLVS